MCDMSLYDIINDINNYLNVVEEKFNIDSNENKIILETKSREEYARLKFKKKYDFKPDKDSKYNDKGTTSVNGERVPVNIGKSKFVDYNGNSKYKTIKDDSDDGKVNIKRNTSVSNGKDNRVVLGNDIFKLKNQKRRDAILYHELTHRKFQLPSGDKKMQVPEVSDLFWRDMEKSLIHDDKLDENRIKRNAKKLKSIFIDNTTLQGKPYDSINKERSDALMKLDSKYTSDTNSHVSGLEKEADVGGAKATSRKDMIKAIHEIGKNENKKSFIKEYGSKSKKLQKEIRKDTLSVQNAKGAEDIKKRSQSLKDSDNKNIDFYNKNMPNEAKK